MSGYGYRPGRGIDDSVEDIPRPRTTRSTTTRDNPDDHPVVRQFKREMAELRRRWDLEDEVKWAEATRSFAARVARR